MKKLYYIAEVLRDVNLDITGYELKYSSNKPRYESYEHVNIRHDEVDISISRVAVDLDAEGNFQLEDDPALVAAAAAEVEIALRLTRMEFGKRIVSIMSIRNDAKGLDATQLGTLLATFSLANTMLINGSIATARGLIDAVTPDGTITTDADKTAILAEIDANWIALGYPVPV